MPLFRSLALAVTLTIGASPISAQEFAEDRGTTFSLRVGSCPTPLLFVLTESWEPSYLSEEATRAVQSNPNRRAIVAGVIQNYTIPDAAMVVMSLGAMEPRQGHLSAADFEGLVNQITSFHASDDEWLLDRVDQEIQRRANGAGVQLLDYDFDGRFLTTPDRFVSFASASTADRRQLSAGVLFFISSCIISVNIGVPERRGFEVLLDAVEALSVYPG